jgi:hypothetical protein
MRTIALCLLLGGVGAGCASPERIREGGYAHLEKARQLEARGDYERAAREREVAQKQFRKAEARASYGYYR